ncbi:MAG: hypothetical protein J6D20_08640 [Clostridia bacterium]|nr:hypothetical protein [Clostridia bacterium]
MVKLSIKLPLSYSREDIISEILSALPVQRDEIRETAIVKRTLNLSDKSDIHYDAAVAFSASPEREAGLLKMKKKVSEYPSYKLTLPEYKGEMRPVVVGAGPAGLFAALALAESGACPILLERGLDVDARGKRVKSFAHFGALDPECNVQFGEGGAGTYSDGKLKVGSMDKYKMKVLSEFVLAGADEDIMYSATAHVGTDKLPGIVKKIRNKITALGGEVLFGRRLSEIKIKDGKVASVVAKTADGEDAFKCDSLVLAAGHSARDVFEILKNIGAVLEPRGFGIGVRIEHPREYINELVYGKNYPDILETASYHLVTHLKNGRSVYSFCMCPGGTVVPAASEEGGIVTNGMSEYLRNGENSNAAFLVSVTPEDFGSDDPLSGIDLQRRIERNAYCLTGSYKAPSQSLASLKDGGLSSSEVKPSYKIGTHLFSVNEYLPDYVCSSLSESIADFDSWMPGFYYPGAAVTGPETRTTSPIRVLRDESGESVTVKGLYPTGEGAGYSGGIVSSARDGIMIAEKILEKHKSEM